MAGSHELLSAGNFVFPGNFCHKYYYENVTILLTLNGFFNFVNIFYYQYKAAAGFSIEIVLFFYGISYFIDKVNSSIDIRPTPTLRSCE